jgi:hypothetical protein
MSADSAVCQFIPLIPLDNIRPDGLTNKINCLEEISGKLPKAGEIADPLRIQKSGGAT